MTTKSALLKHVIEFPLSVTYMVYKLNLEADFKCFQYLISSLVNFYSIKKNFYITLSLVEICVRDHHTTSWTKKMQF